VERTSSRAGLLPLWTTAFSRRTDNLALRKQLATLLYREAVTAYLTLEAQGLIRIEYDPALLESAQKITGPSQILNRFTEDDKKAWMTFLLDWALRFVRYALGSHRWGGPDVDRESLREWNIYPKSAALFRAQDQEIVPFMIKQRRLRNTVYNFASRFMRRAVKDSFDLNIDEFQAAVRPFWDCLLASPQWSAKEPSTAGRPLLNLGGAEPDRCLIQLNFSSLVWKQAPDDEPLFRCDHCGRLSFYSIKGVCPIRGCRGTLKQVSQHEIDANRFSPVRHYRKLVRSTDITPLRVEEHTAQISPQKRNSIERDFRSLKPDSIDVISGSTTFELGIDLGSINSVFMANLPPRAANYRQRAGRAGRRPGAQPFVPNYVRQRPHDQYFWNRPQQFISGPLPTPRLAISSTEVVSRHASAILIARLLELYRSGHPGNMGLSGPPADAFVGYCLSSLATAAIRRELESETALRDRLSRFLRDLPLLTSDARNAWNDLEKKLKALSVTYLSLHAEEGCLDFLSDHGVLPSYAFPIYVDELRLREYSLRDSPRADLKLQRNRAVALREYAPGRTFVAGKFQIVSEGVWQGYAVSAFTFCSHCSEMNFEMPKQTVCARCGTPLTSQKALIPRGGFFGKVIRSTRESSRDETLAGTTDVYFDPADDPPLAPTPVGGGLRIAQLDARQMIRSRMRMLNPSPRQNGILMQTRALNDMALPHSPAAQCLERVADGSAERFHLMHEFTTDILQIQFFR